MLYITSLWLIYLIIGSPNLLISLTNFTHPLLPSLLAPTSLFSVLWVCFCFLMFVHLFCFLDSTYKWNHIAFVFLWLISLSIIPSRSICVAPNGKISFFFMAEYHVYIYICHNLFIYSSMNEHLGCFHILAMVHGHQVCGLCSCSTWAL